MALAFIVVVLMLIVFFWLGIVVAVKANEPDHAPTTHTTPRPRKQTQKPPSAAIRAINRTVDDYADLRRNLRTLERKYADLKEDPEFMEIVINIHAHYKGRKLDLLLRELGIKDRLLPPGDDE